MWRLRQALASFMYGRYGVDKLYWGLFWLWVLIAVVNIFVASAVLYVVELLIMFFMYFRVFSKNIYRRRRENERFVGAISAVRDFFRLQWSRVRDIRYKRYRRCPSCKAVLRLPIKRGKHTAKCPSCGKNFNVRILI